MSTKIVLSDNEHKTLKRSFGRAARWIYKNKNENPTVDDLRENAVKPLIKDLTDIFSQAANKGISTTVPESMVADLTNNVHLFSGAKTHEELTQMSSMLLDEFGNIKSFSTYWKDVQEIHSTYNQSYLEAEYIFATQSAQMASKWAEIEADGDAYDLQYRTAGDDRVREEHAALDETTLPPSDSFWDDFYPPNGWRCRCTVSQVRIGKYDRSDSEEALQLGNEATSGKNEIFRFNPGKDGIIFPENHPYFNGELEGIKKALNDE